MINSGNSTDRQRLHSFTCVLSDAHERASRGADRFDQVLDGHLCY
jgi:hypothetical protein